ncbi:hypothetical protein AMATHDRAFT_8014 [Amanita thiersii Skay4041]|uniref:Rpa49 subunit specific to nuclear RNA polymerase I n=1 Tax=Amanita thiersii Skay4041 TaxID=703135 RepID=A0A2A9NF57_9AGAR|nr:hypothetical protein AMATHDRAFT_8014 [Amanita thiersii Skay4041]
MSTAKSQSRKRKRDSISSDGIVFKLSSPTPGKVGPLLVSYPALEPPTSTPFKCYTRKKAKADAATDGAKEQAQKNVLVVGETDSVEFVSNEDESKKASQAGCQYLISIYDRSTGVVKVLSTPKTPHILSRTVKSLKSILPAPVPSAVAYKEARNTLGETFGTKKAKAAIRAQERKHVDVGAMEGVMDFVMDGIERGSGGLMTQEQAKETADKNRPVPPYSTTATEPEDIYPLYDIIPEIEWKTLSINGFENASSDRDRIALLPYRHSQWTNNHLKSIINESGKTKKKNLKLLLYISALFMFYKAAQTPDIQKEKLGSKLTGISDLVIEGLLSRFSEVPRGSNKHQMTTRTKTMLLTHLFALCLKVDKFATDTTILAHDLSMSVTSVNQLFKSLGCKITTLNDKDLSRLGLPRSAATSKRAVLSAPVEFPKPKVGKK